jgi:hypothetical protein
MLIMIDEAVVTNKNTGKMKNWSDRKHAVILLLIIRPLLDAVLACACV